MNRSTKNSSAPDPSQKDRLIHAILNIFSSGFHITPDIEHFISSTYAMDDMMQISEIFKEENEGEYDSETVSELLFYPDESIQAAIEPILERSTFSPEDECHILDRMSQKKIVTKLIYDEKNVADPVIIPDDICEKFIKRLKITKKQDQTVIEVINSQVEDATKNLAKVKLRNSRFPQTEKITRFLCLFFQKFPSNHKLFFHAQEFLYEFFRHMNHDNDILESLQLQIKFYDYQKKRSEDLQKRIEKSNVEILMLSGCPLTGISIPDAIEKIEIIRTIILYVYSIIVDIYSNQVDAVSNNFSNGQDLNNFLNNFK